MPTICQSTTNLHFFSQRIQFNILHSIFQFSHKVRQVHLNPVAYRKVHICLPSQRMRRTMEKTRINSLNVDFSLFSESLSVCSSKLISIIFFSGFFVSRPLHRFCSCLIIHKDRTQSQRTNSKFIHIVIIVVGFLHIESSKTRICDANECSFSGYRSSIFVLFSGKYLSEIWLS